MEPKQINETTIAEPTHWQTFYYNPYSRRFFNLSIVVLIILFIYFHGFPPGCSILPYLLLSAAMGFAIDAILMDPDTAIRSTRRIEGESGEKGERDKGGRVIIVQRPLLGFERCKTRIETPDRIADELLEGVRHEEAYVRL